MHDTLAFGFFSQRPLDRLDLAANAADPGEQLFLFSDRMYHPAAYRVPPYAMSIAKGPFVVGLSALRICRACRLIPMTGKGAMPWWRSSGCSL
jgi:hypothetical protein